MSKHRQEVLSELSSKDLAPLVLYHSSERMDELEPESVQLVVTSPPYPMIEMWDELFEQSLALPAGGLSKKQDAFDAIHELLSRTWTECYRVLEKGGLLCVNVGDATRSVGGNFRYYMNHARVTEICERIGFQSLVPILWKKPTNKPNAFLGSGFYPPNAYVTLDCEYVLLLRKGSKRYVKPKDPLRYASQFSKVERDVWFSQIWDFRGAMQNEKDTAPFPDELPYRLVRMFSSLGDAVLDPFAGTGTTVRIARALGRKGIGYEVNKALKHVIERNVPLSSPSPPDIVDRILSIYKGGETVAVSALPRFQNSLDQALSSFR